jgi:D-serine deaminase-like pyridoxal phosphate-dependent protein
MRRDEVRTPALLIDRDALGSNIAKMTEWARLSGVSLRPHAKSHKCPEIARRLVRAGAIGASCATIDEAEALAAAGIGGILITSPMAARHMLERLQRLLARGCDVMVVADDPRNVDDLSGAASRSGGILRVLVDIDVGQGRTDCIELADAVALAKRIAGERALEFAGVQAYWGNLQQIMPFEERQRRVSKEMERLRSLIAMLGKEGLPPRIVTGSGTGTHWSDAQHDVFTELQPGSFAFLDSCYANIPLRPQGNPFSPSLFVAASVVTANRPGKVIVNAGLKAFATDSGLPVPVRGAPEDANYRFMGDEHGAIEFDGGPAPKLGATIELLTSHCDPTVNLFSRALIVSGDEVVDEWPILARGY